MADPRVLSRRGLTVTSTINSSSLGVNGVLQGLASCSKNLLQYDTHWKPTREALDEISGPPKLPADLLRSVSPSKNLSLGETNTCSSLEHGSETQNEEGEEEKDQNGVVFDEMVSFIGKKDLEMPKAGCTTTENPNDGLREKELLASYDNTHVVIYRLETEKRLKAQEDLDSREEKLREHSKKLQTRKRRYLQQKENERVEERLQSLQALQLDEKRKSEEARLRQKKLEQSHAEYAQKAVRRVKEVEELRLKVLRQEQLFKKQMMQLETLFKGIGDTASSIQQIFQECRYQSAVATFKPEISQEVAKVLKISQNALDNARESEQVTEANFAFVQDCSKLIQTILLKTKNVVQEATIKATKEEAELQAKAREEEAKKEKEIADKERAQVALMRKKQESQASTSPSQNSSSPAQSKSGLSKELSSCISETAWKEYSRLVTFKSEIVKSAEPLHTDKSLKQLKFDLMKAVSTPVNSISEESILDKIQHLNKFLSGSSIQAGSKQISMGLHEAAPGYCKEQLAKKFVDQGSQQVSSSVSSAFPIAAVIIGVWSRFPDVGDLILVRFYEECPFLVPFYIPKAAGMSDTDYLATIGYVYKDGQIEQQDKYLKRMTGIVRLYAAIVSSEPPPSRQQSKPHPHGIERGWIWLARMLNLQPRADYTATALYEFLSVAGHVLMGQYKKQFGKLLNTLVLDYIPKIEKVTAKEKSGPVSRLKSFLEKCIKDQKIPIPDGYLTPQFWRSFRF